LARSTCMCHGLGEWWIARGKNMDLLLTWHPWDPQTDSCIGDALSWWCDSNNEKCTYPAVIIIEYGIYWIELCKKNMALIKEALKRTWNVGYKVVSVWKWGYLTLIKFKGLSMYINLWVIEFGMESYLSLYAWLFV